jgi:hypothetical protein
MLFKFFKKVTNTLRTLRHIESSFQTLTNREMPGALYNYISHGCGVQDFPVDRDGWSRRVGSSQSITPASSTVMERQTFNPPRVTTEPRVKQSKFKETPENRAPRMRTHAEIKAAKIRREQKKKDSAARVIQRHARKWLERNTIHILRRKLAERDEELSMKKKENKELRMELQRVYRAVDASKKAIGRVSSLKQYQRISGLVEKALSKSALVDGVSQRERD